LVKKDYCFTANNLKNTLAGILARVLLLKKSYPFFQAGLYN